MSVETAESLTIHDLTEEGRTFTKRVAENTFEMAGMYGNIVRRGVYVFDYETTARNQIKSWAIEFENQLNNDTDYFEELEEFAVEKFNEKLSTKSKAEVKEMIKGGDN